MGPRKQRYILRKHEFVSFKIPNNFQQCVIKAATIGFQPFVSLIRNETNEEQSKSVYEIGGLTVEYFQLFIKKINTSRVSSNFTEHFVWRSCARSYIVNRRYC